MAYQAAGVPQFASLYVGDLHPDVTEAMLYEIFNSVGPVGSIRVCRDSVTRRSLGYAYVNFHAVSDAERALDTLNYSSIKGRACRIMWSQRDPSLRKSGVGNIYVRNLDKNIDNKALYDTFSLFGNILSCKVAADPSGSSRGYGFVHYETEEAAKQAIERVNGMQIGDKTVQVTAFVKRNERARPDIVEFTNLYIKNFPEDWSEEKVGEVFGEFGTITSSCVMTDAKGRKFAFVNFETSAQAHACIDAMHDKDLRTEEQKEKDEEAAAAVEDGEKPPEVEKLYVQRAQNKVERQMNIREQSGQSAAPERAQGVNLYVKNLDDASTDETLRTLFEPFGTVTSVSAVQDDKGRCKGFGFVCFSSPDAATKAVTEMHLKVVKGKPLYVGLAEKREARNERLRSRFSAGAQVMEKGGGGKACGKGMPGMPGFKGGMPPQMYNPSMGGPMMGGPQMMGMMGKGGPMMGGPQMQGGPQMMGKGGPMMGGPQMMGMMGKGGPMMGNPQMMGMMGKGVPMMGNPGMMRPMMPQMQGQQPGGPQAQMMAQQQQQMQQQQQQMQQPPRPAMPQQPPPAPGSGAPLNAATLAAAPPAVQKQMIGEKLYPAIARFQPELAGKITGMMLEMDNSELLLLLESDGQLRLKVDEAMRVLEGQK